MNTKAETQKHQPKFEFDEVNGILCTLWASITFLPIRLLHLRFAVDDETSQRSMRWYRLIQGIFEVSSDRKFQFPEVLLNAVVFTCR